MPLTPALADKIKNENTSIVNGWIWRGKLRPYDRPYYPWLTYRWAE